MPLPKRPSAKSAKPAPKANPKLQQKAELIKVRSNLEKCVNEWLKQNAPKMYFDPKFLGQMKQTGVKLFRVMFGTMVFQVAKRDGLIKPQNPKAKVKKMFPEITDKKTVIETAIQELGDIANKYITDPAEYKKVAAFLDKAKPSTMENLGRL